jgi:hypothetical protein
MVKKKPHRAEAATESSGTRKRTISCQELQRAVLTLRQQVGDLEGQLKMMEKSELTEIEIDGYGLLQRGGDEIDRFIENVNKGVNRAKRDKQRLSI